MLSSHLSPFEIILNFLKAIFPSPTELIETESGENLNYFVIREKAID